MGVGLIIGPSLGTVLYDLGGFTLNYWFILWAYVIELALNLKFLEVQRHSEIDQHSLKSTDSDLTESLIVVPPLDLTGKSKVSYLSILSNKFSIFALCSLSFAIMQWAYFDPILTVRFSALGLSEQNAGLAFLGLSIGYAISCAITHEITKVLGNKACL